MEALVAAVLVIGAIFWVIGFVCEVIGAFFQGVFGKDE